MTKHQWLHRVILVAGTIVLASACYGPHEECLTNETGNDGTGEVFCNPAPITGPSSATAQDVTNHPDELRAAPTKAPPRKKVIW